MLKYPITILLILLIALQTFSKWALILEYQVNRDFIAKTLCVNRNKAISCCAGKCYLAKKLANDESQQQAPGRSAQKDESPLQIFVAEDFRSSSRGPITLISHSTRYLSSPSGEFHLLPFQPPRWSC